MKKTVLGLVIGATVVLGGMAQSQISHSSSMSLDLADFAAASSADTALAHLEKFQEIANANNGTRSAGTEGYNQSSYYISMKLIEAGYDVRLQKFSFEMFEKLAPPALKKVAPEEENYVEEENFLLFTYSPSGDVTAEVQAVDLSPGLGNASTSGCEAADFANFVAGRIALLQRGTCTFRQKAENAEAAGAVGVVVFNQGNDEARKGVIGGTLGAGPLKIPVVGVSYDLGIALANEGTKLHVFAKTVVATKMTHNILAETPGGDPDKIVMVGSHLDSVSEGPGINDNGSGSAAILDIALRMKNITPNNKVRFAWWGAEEHGLVGSRYYTGQLSAEEAAKIAVYLNFDMVASPNYILGVYDADGSKFEVPGPPGSDVVEKIFHDYYAFLGFSTVETEANGRSDYVGFAEKGIPFGGAFTGAEVAKTDEQAALFGGTAGAPYDGCYHKECDDLSNINRDALATNLKVITFVTLTLARSTEGLTRDKGPSLSMLLKSAGESSTGAKYDPEAYPEFFMKRRVPIWAK